MLTSSMGRTIWLANKKDMPVPRPFSTWAIEVAVTLSEGGNHTADITSGPDPITTFEMPFNMEQMWQEKVKNGKLAPGLWSTIALITVPSAMKPMHISIAPLRLLLSM